MCPLFRGSTIVHNLLVKTEMENPQREIWHTEDQIVNDYFRELLAGYQIYHACEDTTVRAIHLVRNILWSGVCPATKVKVHSLLILTLCIQVLPILLCSSMWVCVCVHI